MTQISNPTQQKFISANQYHSQQAKTLVIIDASVSNLEILKAGLKPGAEVVVLHPQLNGIEQITTLVSRRKNLQKVHLVSHGSAGSIKLGTSELNIDSLNNYSAQIQRWFAASRDRISLYIYGCQVASGNEGQSFIQELHNLTGANIAAATKKVGSSDDGGVWLLDHKVGSINSEIAFTDEVIKTYSGTFMEEDEAVLESEPAVAELLAEEPLGENLLAEVEPEVEPLYESLDEPLALEVDNVEESVFEPSALENVELDGLTPEAIIEAEAEAAAEADEVDQPVAETLEVEVNESTQEPLLTEVELDELAQEAIIEAEAVEVDQPVADTLDAEVDESTQEPLLTEVELDGLTPEAIIEAEAVEVDQPVADTLDAEVDESIQEPLLTEVEPGDVELDELAQEAIIEAEAEATAEADEVNQPFAETLEVEVNESTQEPLLTEVELDGLTPEAIIEAEAVEVDQPVAETLDAEVDESTEELVSQPPLADAAPEVEAINEVIAQPLNATGVEVEPIVPQAPEVAANDLIDLSGVAEGETVFAEFSVAREAGFNNTVDFYEVNADGSVINPESGESVAVGEAGYSEAALANRIGLELAAENGETAEFSAEMSGGSFYAPILAVETSFDNLSDDDPNNDPDIYFTYADANDDGLDHVTNSAPNVFEFEDLANGGDRDFNDLIVTASFGDTSTGEAPEVEPLVSDESVIEPVVETVVTEAPVFDEPIVEVPELIDEPVVEAPELTEEPVVEAPELTEEPVFDEPVAEAPELIDEPVFDEPIVEAPEVIDEPVFDEPIVEAPEVIDEPVFDEPVAEVPEVIDEPVFDEPVVEAPEVIDEPVADEAEAIDESIAEAPIEESSADSNINGLEIQLAQFAPNLETLVTEPLAAIIGDDVEFVLGEVESDISGAELTNSQIDIISGAPGQASIVYETGSSQPEATFNADEFNGIAFFDAAGDLPIIENVTLDESATTIGLDSSDLTFTEDTILINFESLSIEPGLTAKFDVEFADI